MWGLLLYGKKSLKKKPQFTNLQSQLILKLIFINILGFCQLILILQQGDHAFLVYSEVTEVLSPCPAVGNQDHRGSPSTTVGYRLISVVTIDGPSSFCHFGTAMPNSISLSLEKDNRMLGSYKHAHCTTYISNGIAHSAHGSCSPKCALLPVEGNKGSFASLAPSSAKLNAEGAPVMASGGN